MLRVSSHGMLFFGSALALLRHFSLVAVFIAVVLLSFLLGGCVMDTGSVAAVSLMTLRSSDLEVRVGYLGMCVRAGTNATLACSTSGRINELMHSQRGSAATAVELANVLALSCHPYTLIATLAMALVLVLLLVWGAVPFLPWTRRAQRFNCVLLFAVMLTWGLGSMLQQQATTTLRRAVGPASGHEVVASVGQRSVAMTWTAFAFVLVVFLSTAVGYLRGGKDEREQVCSHKRDMM